MDRFALFIDAGHLLAEGGSLCCGTKSRNAIVCDYRSLIAELGDLCSGECALPMLRTYWYDGAKDAVPTPEQLLIAQLPRTKLRLGRLSGGTRNGRRGQCARYSDYACRVRQSGGKSDPRG